MRSEKIIKRADGSKVSISVALVEIRFKMQYETKVHVCEKGKRTWRSIYSEDDYAYRKLSTEERDLYVKEKQLTVVTEEELHQAKLELWESLKPVLHKAESK